MCLLYFVVMFIHSDFSVGRILVPNLTDRDFFLVKKTKRKVGYVLHRNCTYPGLLNIFRGGSK